MSSFILGGPVQSDSPLYIIRQNFENQVLRESINKKYVSIIGSRQVGKTSLLQRIQKTMEHDYDYAAAIIDMSIFNEQNIDFQIWANQFCDRLIEQLQPYLLGLPLPIVPESPIQFRKYFQLLADVISRPRILILIDEASAIPTNIGDPFYSIIRWIYTQRTETRPNKSLLKYNFAFAGVFEPEKLVKERNNSPFNVSQVIRVPDFTKQEIEKLIFNIKHHNISKNLSLIADAIYYWTKGHPLLTQCYCSLIENKFNANISSPITYEVISQLSSLLKENGATNIDHVIKQSLDSDDLKTIMKQLLAGVTIPFSRGRPAIAKLELIGSITEESENCQFRNRIYEDALSQAIKDTSSIALRDLSQQKEVDPNRLNQVLTVKFDLGEISQLCSDLKISYDDIKGSNLSEKARELVAYMKRRDQLDQLVKAVQNARPTAKLFDD